MIGTAEGIIKVRTVRRQAEHKDRWNIEEFTAVGGTPWEPVPHKERDGSDGNVLSAIPKGERIVILDVEVSGPTLVQSLSQGH